MLSKEISGIDLVLLFSLICTVTLFNTMDNDSWAVHKLSEFLGFDDETLKTQVLPYLKTLKTADEFSNHLMVQWHTFYSPLDNSQLIPYSFRKCLDRIRIVLLLFKSIRRVSLPDPRNKLFHSHHHHLHRSRNNNRHHHHHHPNSHRSNHVLKYTIFHHFQQLNDKKLNGLAISMCI